MKFTYLYKTCFSSIVELSSLPEYDYYISSLIEAERVKETARAIRYVHHILFVPECVSGYDAGSSVTILKYARSDDYNSVFQLEKIIKDKDKTICIDSTGILIPHMLFLLRLLNSIGITNVDIIYAEPLKYKNDEDTQFTDSFYEVSQVTGMAGSHTSRMDMDLLIIAAGYDHSRIIDVASTKKEARKTLLYGFPSISPGMFQENVLRVHEAEDWLGSDCFKDMDMNIYAPAYDPFVTAQVIKDYVSNKEYSNLYLAPLSSKPHALGMALFFLWEKGYEKNISIIYPMCDKVYTDYSEGVGRIWKYNFILPGENHGE